MTTGTAGRARHEMVAQPAAPHAHRDARTLEAPLDSCVTRDARALSSLSPGQGPHCVMPIARSGGVSAAGAQDPAGRGDDAPVARRTQVRSCVDRPHPRPRAASGRLPRLRREAEIVRSGGTKDAAETRESWRGISEREKSGTRGRHCLQGTSGHPSRLWRPELKATPLVISTHGPARAQSCCESP